MLGTWVQFASAWPEAHVSSSPTDKVIETAVFTASEDFARIGGGLVLVVFGVAMITGQVSAFAIWLLDAVPALGRLG